MFVNFYLKKISTKCQLISAAGKIFKCCSFFAISDQLTLMSNVNHMLEDDSHEMLTVKPHALQSQEIRQGITIFEP